jgi:hypothetical protein
MAAQAADEPKDEFDLSNDPIFGNAAQAAEEPAPATTQRVSVENFSDMSNEDIMRVMDSLGLPYNSFDFNRAEAIQAVINNINK